MSPDDNETYIQESWDDLDDLLAEVAYLEWITR